MKPEDEWVNTLIHDMEDREHAKRVLQRSRPRPRIPRDQRYSGEHPVDWVIVALMVIAVMCGFFWPHR